VTAAIKAFGPLAFGGRELSTLLARVIPLLAPALLAALVVTETIGGHGRTIAIDARLSVSRRRRWRSGCARRWSSSCWWRRSARRSCAR